MAILNTKAMTNEQRHKASIDQTIQYLCNYYPDWRFVKILSIKKILDEKESFFSPLIKDINQSDDISGESTIAQEITNGLYLDAISHCVQYVEDLFALIKASKTPDFFIQKIVTYNAGRVTSLIKSYKFDTDNVKETFFIPKELNTNNSDTIKAFEDGVKILSTLLMEISEFYKNYEFFYNQYKHGLAVGMRPFGKSLTKEQLVNYKKRQFKPYLVVYDNMNLEAAYSKGTFKTNMPLLLPNFTPNIQPCVNALINENNYLRFSFPHDTDSFSIDFLITTARKIRSCLHTFINNYYHDILPKKTEKKFQLPFNYLTDEYSIVTIPLDNGEF